MTDLEGDGGQLEGAVTPEPELSGASIDIRLKKAQESLVHCQEAQMLRNLSQSVFAQSESILEEAIRSVEAAVKAYGEYSAAGFSEATTKAQKTAETLKSRLKENQAAYQDALGRALGTNELATKDVAAALASLNFEFMNVERELEESAKASAIAESAKKSAMAELIAVHAMWDGLASPGPRPTELVEKPNQKAGILTGNPKTIDSAAPKQPEPPVAAPKPVQKPAVQPVVFGSGLAKTYTGRVYLMFDASLNREGLQSVWDAVEEAAGPGVIVDTRLVSQEEGVQVTLDLEKSDLDVVVLLRRLPGAEMVPIAKDRLNVAWTAAV